MHRNHRSIVRNSVIVGLAMLAAVGIAGAKPRSDVAISEDANAALRSTTGLKGSAILLETEQGRVTLRGSVAGEKQRVRAAKAVAAVNGVLEVRNLLQVGATAPFATETLTRVHPFVPSLRLGPSTPILDLGPPPGTEAAVVPDEEIRRNVERALLDLDARENASIRVQVSQGVVWLTGSVPTWEGNNDRLHATRSVPGVRSILNELRVAGEDPAR